MGRGAAVRRFQVSDILILNILLPRVTQLVKISNLSSKNDWGWWGWLRTCWTIGMCTQILYYYYCYFFNYYIVLFWYFFYIERRERREKREKREAFFCVANLHQMLAESNPLSPPSLSTFSSPSSSSFSCSISVILIPSSDKLLG